MSLDKQPVFTLPPFEVKTMVSILAEVQDYNHRLMNIPEIWKKTQGEGIKIAVLDTGMPNHPDINPAGGKGFILAEPGYLEDKNGHGTHVAGVINAIANNGMGIQGIAPRAEIYCGAVLNGDGTGTIEDIINGIKWAVDEVGAHIINMSLGISAGHPLMPALKEMCFYAKNKGCIIVCAAGNDSGAVGQPACYDSVIATAAIDGSKKKAYFSNYGPEIDFATGGVDVYSTYLNKGYAKLSGTSMASPALAGAVALILADELAQHGRIMTFEEVYAKLQKIAYDLGNTGFDEKYGWGLPVFQKQDSSDPSPVPAPTPERPKKKKWYDILKFWRWF